MRIIFISPCTYNCSTSLITVLHAQAIQTQRFGVDFFQVDIDGFAIVGTNLDGQGVVFRQHFHAVELGLTGYAVDFVQTLSDFSLDGVEVRLGVGTSRRLNRQLTNTLQVIVDFRQRTFSGLRDGDTIVGVTGRLSQTFDVRGEAVSNRLTSSIIFRAVDTQTRGQTLDSGAQGRLRFVQVILGQQRQAVCIDDLCHDLFLINYNLMLLGCCPRFLTVTLVSAP